MKQTQLSGFTVPTAATLLTHNTLLPLTHLLTPYPGHSQNIMIDVDAETENPPSKPKTHKCSNHIMGLPIPPMVQERDGDQLP